MAAAVEGPRQYKRPASASARKIRVLAVKDAKTDEAKVDAPSSSAAAAASAAAPTSSSSAAANEDWDVRKRQRLEYESFAIHARRERQKQKDELAAQMRKTDIRVAKIPFHMPPPKDPKRGTDLLKRVFYGEAEAREALYDYVCRVQKVVNPVFVDRIPGRSDNPHSAAMKAVGSCSPIPKPTLQCLEIITGLATMGNVDSFHNNIAAQCDAVAFRNFMQHVGPWVEASIKGTDIGDVGEQRVKNAAPTFGVNAQTFVAMVRGAYAGVLVPLHVPILRPDDDQEAAPTQAPAAAAAVASTAEGVADRQRRNVPT